MYSIGNVLYCNAQSSSTSYAELAERALQITLETSFSAKKHKFSYDQEYYDLLPRRNHSHYRNRISQLTGKSREQDHTAFRRIGERKSSRRGHALSFGRSSSTEQAQLLCRALGGLRGAAPAPAAHRHALGPVKVTGLGAPTTLEVPYHPAREDRRRQ
jgi:hypothetical protein